jgi:hypothetical protein
VNWADFAIGGVAVVGFQLVCFVSTGYIVSKHKEEIMRMTARMIMNSGRKK